jgi:hypothetical protein
MEDELSKKRHPSKSLSRSSKRQAQSQAQKQEHSDIITLNYGFDITAVFELINEHIVYNKLITYYIKNRQNSIETIKAFLLIIINYINNPENETIAIRYQINELKKNELYKSLSPKLQSGDLNKDLTTELDKLFDTEKDKPFSKTNSYLDKETKHNIQKWSNFINIGLIIIKYMLKKVDSFYTIEDVIEVLDNLMPMEKTIFISFNNFFDFKLNKNIKLYKSVNEFNHAVQNDGEISLCLRADYSAICDNKEVYKDISSGKLLNYYKLLNNCEFITKPFKTIDDISRLSIFYDDPIIKDTLLNCASTSQYVHISFNKNKKIIKPDTHLVLAIVCVCYFFQRKIFKLFLKTRSKNKFCRKLRYNKKKIYDKKIIDEYKSNYRIEKNEDEDEDEDEWHKDNINKIFILFYTQDRFHEKDIRNNSFFWINILNLHDTTSTKPYTIEFRVKQGSNDVKELQNVCKLYTNIINYATKILKENEATLRSEKSNMIDFISEIETIINENKNQIFKNEILKDTGEYFTNSIYTQGIYKLNQLIVQQPLTPDSDYEPDSDSGSGSDSDSDTDTDTDTLYGGKPQNREKNIDKFIKKLETKKIYKFNSFGIQYIGKGLNEYVINKLKSTFIKNDLPIDDNYLKKYLELYNIYYDIKKSY